MISIDDRLFALERTARRQRWLIVLLAVFVVGLSWVVVYRLPQPYVAAYAAGGLRILSNDQTDEAYLMEGWRLPNGETMKTMSLSTRWTLHGDRILVTRLNTAVIRDGVQFDDIGLMQCGGHGSVFFPANARDAGECPGDRKVKINGDLVVTGKVIQAP